MSRKLDFPVNKRHLKRVRKSPFYTMLSGIFIGVVGNYATRFLDYVFLNIYGGSSIIQLQLSFVIIGTSWFFSILHKSRLDYTESLLLSRINDIEQELNSKTLISDGGYLPSFDNSDRAMFAAAIVGSGMGISGGILGSVTGGVIGALLGKYGVTWSMYSQNIPRDMIENDNIMPNEEPRKYNKDLKDDEETNILIVDDNAKLADLLAAWLDTEYNVKTAYNSNEALEKLNSRTDLLVLDRVMSEMIGNKLLSSIRDSGFDCSVLMVSSKEPDLDLIDLDFEEYINKPVSKDELIDRANRALLLSNYPDEIRRIYALKRKKEILEESIDKDTLNKSDKYKDIVEDIERSKMVLEMVGDLMLDVDRSGV